MNMPWRMTRMPRELKLFAGASLAMGAAYSVFDATFNNFLDERYQLTGFQRSFLELPRELPGFLVVFVSALLWFLCSRRLGALALALGMAGTLLVGFIPSNYAGMLLCLFVLSMGQHLFMPLASTIGMELAREGQTGRRLGQLNAIRNFATILGSFVVFIGFRFLGFGFRHTFTLTAIGLAVGFSADCAANASSTLVNTSRSATFAWMRATPAGAGSGPMSPSTRCPPART